MRRILVSLLVVVVVVIAGGAAYVWLSLTGAFNEQRTPAALLALLAPAILALKPDAGRP